MKKSNVKTINPKVSVYLFSKEVPQGQIFKFVGGKDSEQYKEMLEDGWLDSPAKLNLPKKDDVGITIEQAENADPMHLKIMLEKTGFIVMTPEQMKAEITKMVDTHIDIKHFDDETLIAEAERRGLKEGDGGANVEHEPNEDLKAEETDGIVNTSDLSEDEIKALNPHEPVDKIAVLLEEFNECPESLNIDELVFLGNTKYSLGLRSNMKEATLIAKITEALNAE